MIQVNFRINNLNALNIWRLKLRNKRTVGLFLLFIIFILIDIKILILFQSGQQEIKFSHNKDLRSLSAQAHDPIYIYGNSDLAEFCEIGNGTEENPYVIENYEIDATTDCGINLGYIDHHLIIRNCIVYYGNLIETYESIYIEHCENVHIYNNEIKNSYHGIYLLESANNTISGNNCTSNEHYGIYLDNSDNNIISGNNCTSNEYDGIYLDNSDNNIISGNNCSLNDENGLTLYFSDENIISGTYCTLNFDDGIYLSYSMKNSITINKCKNNRGNGIELRDSNNNTLSGNNCSDHGDLFLDYGSGIYLDYDSNYNNISGNVLIKNSDGINIYEGNSNMVFGNNCSNNLENGISMGSGTTSSNLNILWKNNFFDNKDYQTYYESGCINNQWYKDEVGNYYGDYLLQNPDAQNDGEIWDSPYYLNGTTSDIDPYPLVELAEDITPPNWNPIPENQIINEGVDLSYQISATDDIAIDEYWINDTSIFTINPFTGILTNNTPISAGEYHIMVYAKDTGKNQINAKIIITVQDMSPPTWNPIPENQIIDKNETYTYDINASDNTVIDEYWINDTVYFIINKTNGVLTNNTILELGQYDVKLYVNDTWGNQISKIITIDVKNITKPEWIEVPKSQTILASNSFLYNVNATDDVAIDVYWLNSSTYFQIDCTGLITNSSQIPLGDHPLKIFVNDTQGYEIFATIIITAFDDIAPIWEETPIDQIFEYNRNNNYDINASDNVKIDQYWLSNPTDFSIDQNGIVSNNGPILEGDYPFTIYVNDTSGNILDGQITITVIKNIDENPPGWEEELKDQHIPFWEDFIYDVNASDNVAIDQYRLETSDNFTINSDGLISNSTALFPGEFFMVVSVNDTSGNIIYASIKITIESDWDRDGMHDRWEIGHGLNPNGDDADKDPDEDGLSNLDEYIYNTDPGTKDTEGDGTPDGWEINNSLDPNVDDANNDPDGDGLSNLEEYSIETNPHHDDSDQKSPTWDEELEDQHSPFWEDLMYDVNASDNVAIDQYRLETSDNFTINSDGLISNSTALFPGEFFMVVSVNDTSGNIIYASIKITIESDWDRDGMHDRWEIGHGLNPNGDDADKDPDEDGHTNLEEYHEGTNPFNDDEQYKDGEEGGAKNNHFFIIIGMFISRLAIGLAFFIYMKRNGN